MKEKSFERIILFSGITTFLYLLILSQVFFKERTCFADMSFILFNIIKDHSLTIQVNRFGSAITQIFPLTGVWLGCSLETIMRLYSASFIIWYFVVFLICVFLFRKPKHALLILSFATLMVSDTFYWTTNEQLQGIAFIILLFAFIDRVSEKHIRNSIFYPLLTIGIFTAAFFHPLVIVSFSFYCIYRWIKEKNKIWIISISLFYCCYFIKLLFFTSNNYDEHAFQLLKTIPENSKHLFSLIPSKNFIEYIFRHYYLWLISLIIISIYYFQKRNLKFFLLIHLFTWFYLFVIIASFADNNLKFYMESHYLMLGFFVSVPLCFEILPALKQSSALYIILLSSLLIRCADITTSHKKFTARINWMENFQTETNRLKQKKIIVNDSQVPMDTLLITWGTAYESWLISALENPDNQRSILIDYDFESLKWALPENKSFITRWGVFPYKKLPEKYFKLNDTSEYVFYKNETMK